MKVEWNGCKLSYRIEKTWVRKQGSIKYTCSYQKKVGDTVKDRR